MKIAGIDCWLSKLGESRHVVHIDFRAAEIHENTRTPSKVREVSIVSPITACMHHFYVGLIRKSSAVRKWWVRNGAWPRPPATAAALVVDVDPDHRQLRHIAWLLMIVLSRDGGVKPTIQNYTEGAEVTADL
eukprot:SAG31_NODE_4246_length_3420_cov_3.037338_2_plen_132_part_00